MRLLLLGLCLMFSTTILGQVNNPEFDKIAKRYEKGSFQSALESAEALIDNDKHGKKPEPYLWASMCFYEIHHSGDEKLLERFKSALRDALKYAGKAVSKDKDGSIVADNQQYFDTMKKEGIAFAQAYEQEGDLRKASYTYKQLQTIDPTDSFIQFAKGVMDIRMGSLYEAEREIKASFPILKENYRNLEYQPNPISSPLLRSAVLDYAEHLMVSNYTDSAKTVLLSARVFFPLDDEIKLKLQDL